MDDRPYWRSSNRRRTRHGRTHGRRNGPSVDGRRRRSTRCGRVGASYHRRAQRVLQLAAGREPFSGLLGKASHHDGLDLERNRRVLLPERRRSLLHVRELDGEVGIAFTGARRVERWLAAEHLIQYAAEAVYV